MVGAEAGGAEVRDPDRELEHIVKARRPEEPLVGFGEHHVDAASSIA
jgi:hypothetical protein